MENRMKMCPACGVSKHRSQFNLLTKGRLSHKCSDCTRAKRPSVRGTGTSSGRNKTHTRTEERRRYERNHKLIWQYGITLEEFEKMRRQQRWRCAICKERKLKLCVDHDHPTGKVRGLLCLRCNRALGLFHDDAARLQNAVAYVRNHEVKYVPV